MSNLSSNMDDSSTDVLNDIDALLNKLKHLPEGSRRDVLCSLQARLQSEVPSENAEKISRSRRSSVDKKRDGTATAKDKIKEDIDESQSCEREEVIIVHVTKTDDIAKNEEGYDIVNSESSLEEGSSSLKNFKHRSPRKKTRTKKVVVKEGAITVKQTPKRRLLTLPSRYRSYSEVPTYGPPRSAKESTKVSLKSLRGRKIKCEKSTESVKECQIVVTKLDEADKVDDCSEREDATFGAKILLAAAKRNELDDLNGAPEIKVEPEERLKPIQRKPRKKCTREDKTCNICQRTYVNACYLRIHMRKHTGEKPFQCERCGRSFSQKSSLWVHMKRHDGKFDYKCTECDYKSVLKIDLDRHMPKHTGAKIYICELCGKMFTTDMRLKDHIRHVHERKEKHICDQCGFHTHRADNLRRHISVKHSDDELFKCPICGDVLKQRWTFIVHLRRHTGERPHVCSECQKGFKSLSQLAVHRRTHKEGEHHCPDCNRMFKTKYHLIRHSVIHSGEKPFACPHCPYTCNVKGNINKHMKTVHKLSNFSFRRLKKLAGTIPPAITTEASEKSATQRGEQVTQDFLNRISLRKDENLTVEALQQMITKEPDDVEEEPVIKPARSRNTWVKKRSSAANKFHSNKFHTYDLTAQDDAELLQALPDDEQKVDLLDLDEAEHDGRPITSAQITSYSNGFPVTCVITSNDNDAETVSHVKESNSSKQTDENCGDLLLFSVKECLGEQVTTVESTDGSGVMHLPMQVQDVCMNEDADPEAGSTICYVIQVNP